MTQTYRRKKMWLPPRLILKRLGRLAFLVLVVALVPVVLGYLLQYSGNLSFNGVVEAEAENLGALQTSRILSVEVVPGQSVAAGDILVRLASADRDMDLAMNAARLKDYEQSILRYQQNARRHHHTLQETERRCRQAIQDIKVNLENKKMARARERAELEALQTELARLQPLVERRLIQETELSRLRPAVRSLERAIEEHTPLIRALEEQLQAAEADLTLATQAVANNPMLADNPALLAAMQAAAESCHQAATNETTILRASRAGVVSRVLHYAGDVVAGGQPLVRITAPTPRYVIGMLTQHQTADFAVGDTLKVVRITRGTHCAPTLATIEAIEPEILDLLEPYNPVPRYPVRGQRVRARLHDENNHLIPGEAVVLEACQPLNLPTLLMNFCIKRN